MKIEFREAEERNFGSITRLFQDSKFFFDTKRPESLSEGNIRKLIFKRNKRVLMIFCEDTLQGLVSFVKDQIDNEAVLLGLRMKDMDLLLNNANEIYGHLEDFISSYKRIKMKIYDFDFSGKKLCELLSFNAEAALKDHVYKNNCYHDLIIYSKKVN